MPSPLYRPDPSIGDDDGIHVQAVTSALVGLAERTKDYDGNGNYSLLPAIRGHIANTRRQLDALDKKVEQMIEDGIKANKKVIARRTKPFMGRIG